MKLSLSKIPQTKPIIITLSIAAILLIYLVLQLTGWPGPSKKPPNQVESIKYFLALDNNLKIPLRQCFSVLADTKSLSKDAKQDAARAVGWAKDLQRRQYTNIGGSTDFVGSAKFKQETYLEVFSKRAFSESIKFTIRYELVLNKSNNRVNLIPKSYDLCIKDLGKLETKVEETGITNKYRITLQPQNLNDNILQMLSSVPFFSEQLSFKGIGSSVFNEESSGIISKEGLVFLVDFSR